MCFFLALRHYFSNIEERSTERLAGITKHMICRTLQNMYFGISKRLASFSSTLKIVASKGARSGKGVLCPDWES